MPIILPEEKTRELPPDGAHTACCCSIVDLGTQTTKFGNRRQLYVAWELPDERDGKGNPQLIGKRYALSAHQRSTLRADLEGWLGRSLSAADFGQLDLATFLGRTCTLAVKHETRDGKAYANIASVMRPGRTTPERLPLNRTGAALSLDDRPFDRVTFEALPDWMRTAILNSPEYHNAQNGGDVFDQIPSLSREAPPRRVRDELDDEIPF